MSSGLRRRGVQLAGYFREEVDAVPLQRGWCQSDDGRGELMAVLN